MNRFQEPSTWAGVASIGGLIVQFAPLFGPYAWLATIIGGVMGTIGGGAAIKLREGKPAAPAEKPARDLAAAEASDAAQLRVARAALREVEAP